MQAIPAGVAGYLDGENLLAKTQAVRLSTVDADGWPRAALLGAGEIVVLANGSVRFAIFPESGTAANLARDGRISMSLSRNGGMCELRMLARRLFQATPEVPLACFEAEVVERARTSRHTPTSPAGSPSSCTTLPRYCHDGSGKSQLCGRRPHDARSGSTGAGPPHEKPQSDTEYGAMSRRRSPAMPACHFAVRYELALSKATQAEPAGVTGSTECMLRCAVPPGAAKIPRA